MDMNFTPRYLTRDTAPRWPSLWATISTAYEAAGLPVPPDPNEHTPGSLKGTESADDVTDSLKAAFLDGHDLDADALADYEQRWHAAQFAQAAQGAIARARHSRASIQGADVLANALHDLAPRFDSDAKALSKAAKALHPSQPLDPADAIANGSGQALTKAQGTLRVLAGIASLHVIGRDTYPGDRQAIVALAPVLDFPVTGYPEPRSVDDAAKGIGTEPHAGTRTVQALAAVATQSRDLALVHVARGDFPGVTIALAADQAAIATRLARIATAFDSLPYTYERARQTQRGYMGQQENAPAWVRYVIAHRTGQNSQYVPIGSARSPQAA